MEIKTKRLIIRPFKDEDGDDLFEFYSNKNTCRFLLHEVWNASTKSDKF